MDVLHRMSIFSAKPSVAFIRTTFPGSITIQTQINENTRAETAPVIKIKNITETKVCGIVRVIIVLLSFDNLI